MAYSSKNSGKNPLTGRRMKTATARTIGGRKSTSTASKMRPARVSTQYGRSGSASNSPKANEELGKLGGATLGGGSLGAQR
jgi:hypothetical protein